MCHVTHLDSTQAITAQAITAQVAQLKELIFHAQPKVEKCGYQVNDGSPLGESYRSNLNGSVPDIETHNMQQWVLVRICSHQDDTVGGESNQLTIPIWFTQVFCEF